MHDIILETERLILRLWREADAHDYYEINQDPRVLEFLGGPLTMKQVTDFFSVANDRYEKQGFTLWAVELKESSVLIGFIGLDLVRLDIHFTPAVEIAWRLGSQYWGNGYATEGARAALAYGFKSCGLKEIVSFTVPANHRSLRVMEKIGLHRDVSGDFAHPLLPATDSLSQHLLYRLSLDDYMHDHRQEEKS